MTNQINRTSRTSRPLYQAFMRSWRSGVGFALAVAAASVFVVSCRSPNAPEPEVKPVLGKNGAYILSEGLFRQDNTTLTRFDAGSGLITNDFFARANPGLRLGDTGNDMVLRGRHVCSGFHIAHD
jgi:hypothetical protein